MVFCSLYVCFFFLCSSEALSQFFSIYFHVISLQTNFFSTIFYLYVLVRCKPLALENSRSRDMDIRNAIFLNHASIDNICKGAYAHLRVSQQAAPCIDLFAKHQPLV
jgi:hypothetical protein